MGKQDDIINDGFPQKTVALLTSEMVIISKGKPVCCSKVKQNQVAPLEVAKFNPA